MKPKHQISEEKPINQRLILGEFGQHVVGDMIKASGMKLKRKGTSNYSLIYPAHKYI